MAAELETRIVEHMRPLFGEFAATALQQQKAKLGLAEQPGRDEYLQLVEEIRTMCDQVAGPAIAAKVYEGLVKIVKEGA